MALNRKLAWTGLIAIVVVVVESASFAVGKLLQAKWSMYAAPHSAQQVATYSQYLRRRDPILGWPFPDQLGSRVLTAAGSRPSPAFPDTTPENSDISLYGDSFTQSANSDEDAWSNVLAVLSSARVANYGQGGYGTDQAYLRFKENRRDHSSIVVLSHLTEDILRNITRNRDLITYEMWYAYKPRFVLGSDGSLELVPIPDLSEEEHLRFEGLKDPPLLLEHESFQPGGPAGATSLRFPFLWSVIRNLGDFRMRARLARRPIYEEFYRRGHPLQALEITREICRAFVAEAWSRGQVPLVALLPNRDEVEHFRKSKRWYYEPLLDELRLAEIDTIEFGTRLAERAGDRSLDEFYNKSGHFNRDTDRALAEFVFEKIRTLPAWQAIRLRSGK